VRIARGPLDHRMHPWVGVPHYNADQSQCLDSGCYAILWAEDDRVEGAALDFGCPWTPYEALDYEFKSLAVLRGDVEETRARLDALEEDE
jgi:hypothetical protein